VLHSFVASCRFEISIPVVGADARRLQNPILPGLPGVFAITSLRARRQLASGHF